MTSRDTAGPFRSADARPLLTGVGGAAERL